ncbi:hypothetical protein TNIN_485161 [Trichonephila inaurata madagascariensis]|uniref:EGF-like domain-containing protein n=1 Tax=Trichonephila inaurata madagascariensis TaxID=2747483 RepID=A0A8X7CG07_9ARAC|nr:hypothetical protein TNIN_485161 [Trichonephila inaurata madagascariensis]
MCTVNGDTFNCMCKAPYIGEKCEKMDPCATLPCQNGGVCSVNGDSFKCMCKTPYTGEKCEKMDPCATRPCQNGGVCSVNGDSFKCMCKIPYTGEKCEKTCKENGDCKNGASCKNNACVCEPGYEGDKCEKIKNCENLECNTEISECVLDENTNTGMCKCNEVTKLYLEHQCVGLQFLHSELTLSISRYKTRNEKYSPFNKCFYPDVLDTMCRICN